ncbi:MAG: M16 family metallopeptidase [Caulobacterales bacterium]
MAELITLTNGVRVALDPMPGLATTAVGVYVRVGTRFEAAVENGVAHLFEHMAFKGAGGRDAKTFAEAIESVGGMVNASTGYERTGYYARVTQEHACFALDLLSDIVLAPHWDPEDLEKEKSVVLQEMGEAFDQADDRVFELQQGVVFPDQPLGRPILGQADTLAGINVGTLQAFRDKHLSGPSLVVAAAGAFDRDRLLAAAQARFGGLASRRDVTPMPAVAHGGVVREARKLEQTHLTLSWPGVATGHADAYTMRVLAEILGGGMASRLFQEVREKRGLVYAIDAFAEGYDDVGRMGVYAGCAPKDADEVIRLSTAGLEDLALHGPTEAELARAKAVLRASILMGAEAPAARADARASQVFLRGELMDFESLAARFEAVPGEDVARVAARALAGPVACAQVGPKGPKGGRG